MASGPSTAVLNQLNTLFQVGTIGGLTDGQLLDRFVQQRDEAAFAALVERHGPMVLRVCRGRLGDHHDAEDAFQATFLVLAQKARSIRESEAVAGWLLGVAGRVSAKARSAARRRSIAEQKAVISVDLATTESPREPWAELYDELEGLPEKYRLPLVLCYLEGLTYEQAAVRLGCPMRTVQSRLARGRERLRGRLERRGLAPSAGLVGAARLPEMVPSIVSGSLIEITVRAAMRLANLKRAAAGAPSAAVLLAEEVLHAMFLTQLDALVKLVVILGLVGAGGWLAWPKMGPPKPNPSPRLTARTEQAAPAAREQAVPQKEDNRFQMTGFVRVEGTGEPVEGAKVQVELGMKDLQYEFREALTDTDGHYTIALPEGSARASAPNAPSGYWLPEPGKHWEFFAVTPQQPVYQKDYRVRRGTPWTFRLTEGPKQEPVRSGMVASYGIPGEFSIHVRSETNDKGLAFATLPGEAGKLTLSLSRKTGNEAMRLVKLDWDQGFRPDAIKDVKRLADPGQPVRFRLTDDAGRAAMISGPAEPVITEGRLVVNTSLPERTLESTGTLTGTVVDKDGHPVADAHVTISYAYRQGGAISGQPEHRVRSDARGRYVLRAIPLQSYEGDPTKLSLVVYKDGYAGVGSGIRVFQPGVYGTQVVDPICLQPGTSLSGIVLDPNGLPVVGAEIRPTGSWAQSAWTYRSGPDGRFTIPNLRKGVVFVDITFGKLTGAGRYVVDGKGEVLKVQLRSAPNAKLAAPAAKPIPPNPLKVGQFAPRWVVRGWTDGKERSLADFQGKVVFLEFWGIWCGPCVASLPVVEELRRKYEPQGVVFLSIHTPGEPLDKIRKLYDVNKVPLISALDEGPDDDIGSGITARAYGVGGYPTTILIDKTGKIAYRSNDPANRPAMEALVKKLGIDTNAPTQEKFNQLAEVLFCEAIEKVLAQP